MKFKNLCLLCILSLLVACVLPVVAQPYYTNTVPANGAYLPNASAVNNYQALIVQRQQQNAGINSGSFTTVAPGTYTNVFPATAYAYTAVPVVTVTQVGAIQTGTNLVVSVTTSNFVYQSGAVGTVANYTAIGH